jgi:signal transduction histidine kinase
VTPAAISLQRRLAWRLFAVLVAALTLAFVGFLYRTAVAVDGLDDASLQAQAEAISNRLSMSAGGEVRVNLPAITREAYMRPDHAYFFAVYGPGERVMATSSETLARELGPYIPAGTAARFFRVETSPLAYYGYITGASGLRIVVAQSEVHRDVLADSMLDEFTAAIVWWVIPVILVAVWIGVITIRAGLAPLAAVSSSASEIGPGNLSGRLGEDRVPVEILPLVGAINGALDRVEKGYQAQRRFAADAAHQLRTPLALLQARLDGAGSGTIPAEAIRRDVSRLNRVVGQLLQVARVDAAHLDLTAEVNLTEVAARVVSELAPLAVREHRSLALESEAEVVGVRGDRDLIAEALANLVENALAHTPRGTAVTVRIRRDAALEVLDKGPGVAEAHRSAVFERFWRGPDRRHAGAGLGLAIVADIARLHGGCVAVSDRPGGGAAFVLELPPVAAETLARTA